MRLDVGDPRIKRRALMSEVNSSGGRGIGERKARMRHVGVVARRDVVPLDGESDRPKRTGWQPLRVARLVKSAPHRVYSSCGVVAAGWIDVVRSPRAVCATASTGALSRVSSCRRIMLRVSQRRASLFLAACAMVVACTRESAPGFGAIVEAESLGATYLDANDSRKPSRRSSASSPSRRAMRPHTPNSASSMCG